MGAEEDTSTNIGVFAGFTPGESDSWIDVVAEHDRFGLE
jgi:hypothetical protein